MSSGSGRNLLFPAESSKGVLQRQFVDLNGYWSQSWAVVLMQDEDFFASCLKLMASPSKIDALDKRTRELIHVAVNVACTHLNEEGTRRHIRRAIENGASKNELTEVVQLAAVLGIHSCSVGVPMLLRILSDSAAVETKSSNELDSLRNELKTNFIRKRGYWTPIWDGLLEHSPSFFESYTGFSSFPWDNGALQPKIKEFIYIAIDLVTNHLFEPGAELHIKNAIGYGASLNELLEVIETVSLIGLQSVELGYSIINEEFYGR